MTNQKTQLLPIDVPTLPKVLWWLVELFQTIRNPRRRRNRQADVMRSTDESIGTVLACLACLMMASVSQASEPDANAAHSSLGSMILVIGAPGADEYKSAFDEWSDRWMRAAELGGLTLTLVGRDANDVSDRRRLQEVLAQEVQKAGGPLWIVLIGHGTFDGRSARFNLRGADVAASELADWLSGANRPLAIINCSSASGPFIDRLMGDDRVIVTATKSGGEGNYSRFGAYLSQAISELDSDLDKDGQVSLLEAFLSASRQTAAYYDGQRQLATEHALLEDNGDGRGVRADFFTGLNPTKPAESGVAVDGRRAHQWHLIPSDDERRLPPEIRLQRDELELQLAALRDRKSELSEDDYYARIEELLVEIARLYDAAEEGDTSNATDSRATVVPTPGITDSDDRSESAAGK